jgi:hypothetical protein
MTDTTFLRFRSELDSFFLLTLLNVVFGALAVAFAIQFIVTSILGLTDWSILPLSRIAAGAISMICFGLGLSWLISSVEIMDGIDDIRTEIKGRTSPISDEILISGIVRMIAHYREHKKTIRTMILVCTLGGFCFLALGILNGLEFASIGLTSGTFTLNSYLLIPSALLALGIAAASLLSSYYFKRFSRAWDLRQDGLSLSEHALAEKLGRE